MVKTLQLSPQRSAGAAAEGFGLNILAAAGRGQTAALPSPKAVASPCDDRDGILDKGHPASQSTRGRADGRGRFGGLPSAPYVSLPGSSWAIVIPPRRIMPPSAVA